MSRPAPRTRRSQNPDDPFRRLCRLRPNLHAAVPPRLLEDPGPDGCCCLCSSLSPPRRRLAHFLVLPYHWLSTSLTLLAALALLIGFAFAITPVSFLVAGFFFDELASIVEAEIDPQHPGRTAPLGEQIRVAVVFAIARAGAQYRRAGAPAGARRQRNDLSRRQCLSARPRLFRARGAALSVRSRISARVRRAHEFQIFLAGMFIAALAAVPIANLLTPLFGAALMVRVHDKIAMGPAKA